MIVGTVLAAVVLETFRPIWGLFETENSDGGVVRPGRSDGEVGLAMLCFHSVTHSSVHLVWVLCIGWIH